MYVINNKTDLDYYKALLQRERRLAQEVALGGQPEYIFSGKAGASAVLALCDMMESMIDFYEMQVPF